MAKTLGIALLGLGRAGRFHRASLRQSENATLVAVYDTDADHAQEVADTEGCRAAQSAEDAMNDHAVDAIIIATPTDTHYDYVITALELGKAVFAEKPLGRTLKQLDSCFQKAEEKNCPLFVAFNRRFDPSFASLVQTVRDGGIGGLRFVRTVSRDNPIPSIEYLRESGGIFQDCVVHDLDMICHIVGGVPEHLSAFATNNIPEIEAINDFDNVVATLSFPSGVVASIDVNRESVVGYDQRVEAFGSGGTIYADNWHNTSVTHATSSGYTRPLIDYSFPTRYREAYTIELNTFIECVQTETPVPITYQDVRVNHLLACGLEIAAREKRVVPYDEIEAIVVAEGETTKLE